MNIEEIRDYCLSIKGCAECFPFGEDTLVYKVMDKVFAFATLEPKNGDFWVNMKCDPEYAIELREHYNGITPGYHMNKKMWNTIYLDSDVPSDLIKKLINHSVDEVIKKLSKVKQNEYRNS